MSHDPGANTTFCLGVEGEPNRINISQGYPGPPGFKGLPGIPGLPGEWGNGSITVVHDLLKRHTKTGLNCPQESKGTGVPLEIQGYLALRGKGEECYQYNILGSQEKKVKTSHVLQ